MRCLKDLGASTWCNRKPLAWEIHRSEEHFDERKTMKVPDDFGRNPSTQRSFHLLWARICGPLIFCSFWKLVAPLTLVQISSCSILKRHSHGSHHHDGCGMCERTIVRYCYGKVYICVVIGDPPEWTLPTFAVGGAEMLQGRPGGADQVELSATVTLRD